MKSFLIKSISLGALLFFLFTKAFANPLEPTAKTIRTSDFNWQLYTFGKAAEAQASVLVLHGGGSFALSFKKPIAIWASDLPDLMWIVPDLPGHGKTEYQEGNTLSLPYFCKNLSELLSQLPSKLRPKVAMGHSWGGGFLLYCVGNKTFNLEKLVLLAPSGISAPDSVDWELLKIPWLGSWMSRLIGPSLIKIGLERAYFDKTKVQPELLKSYQENLATPQVKRAQHYWARNLSWRFFTDQTVGEDFPETLIFWGQEDRYLDIRLAKEFEQHLKAKVQIIRLPNLGHNLHEENPYILTSHLKSFLYDEAKRLEFEKNFKTKVAK